MGENEREAIRRGREGGPADRGKKLSTTNENIVLLVAGLHVNLRCLDSFSFEHPNLPTF